MIHSAAQGSSYACFVRPDSRIPFMAIPDAIKALIDLSQPAKSEMKHLVYNVGSFSLSAGEIKDMVLKYYPHAKITFEADPKRQQIVDTWPADVDDSSARSDWGWQPEFDAVRTFDEYLIPNIAKRYQTA